MKNKMYLWAGIVGGIAYLLIGMVVFGKLLMNFMGQHSGLPVDLMTQVNRSPDHMILWAVILANLSMGFLIATVFQWANISTAVAGARAAAIIAILMTMSFDFIIYAFTHLWSLTFIATDLVAWTCINIVVGAIEGWMMGKGASETTTA